MSNLLVAVSGCGGGSLGPQKIYRYLHTYLEEAPMTVWPADTQPDLISENVEQISQLALKLLESYDNLYLMGHSMGGAIVAQVANTLFTLAEGRVKGAVLLGTQTDGLHDLWGLGLPILFYHGGEDHIFRPWEIESLYNRYVGPKKMVQLQGVGHDFAPEGTRSYSRTYTHRFARQISEEIVSFFFPPNPIKVDEGEGILYRNIEPIHHNNSCTCTLL